MYNYLQNFALTKRFDDAEVVSLVFLLFLLFFMFYVSLGYSSPTNLISAA